MTSTPTPPKMTPEHAETVEAFYDATATFRDKPALREVHALVRSLVSGERELFDPKITMGIARSLVARIAQELDDAGSPFAKVVRGWLTESTPASTPDGESK